MFNFHKNKKCSHLLFIWRRWHLASVGRARWRFLVLHHGQRGQRTHRVAIHVKAINFDSRLWRKDKSTQRVGEIVRERDKENRRRLHYLCWLSKSECSSNRNNNNNNESDSHYKCSICMSTSRGGVGGGGAVGVPVWVATPTRLRSLFPFVAHKNVFHNIQQQQQRPQQQLLLTDCNCNSPPCLPRNFSPSAGATISACCGDEWRRRQMPLFITLHK